MVIKGYEKRLWSDASQGSEEKIKNFKRQILLKWSLAERNTIALMSVKDLLTALREEISSGVQPTVYRKMVDL